MEKHILEKAILEGKSMRAAARILKIKDWRFRKLAEEYGLWKPNLGGKGIKKPRKEGNGKIPTTEILKGLHPTYKTNHLKHRLFEESIKENKCEECGIEEWNGKSLMCHLDHVNGNSTDHRIENIKILCPNCHSQTSTYCQSYKNTKKEK